MSEILINAIAYQEGDLWVVQGIEYDIAAQAKDVQSVPMSFMKAVVENICITEHLGRKPLEGVKAAPIRFKDMFDRAQTALSMVSMPNTGREMPAIDIRLVEA